MKLAAAERLAEKVLLELEPYCMRAQIAGSIRRKRAEVNDIDLVLVPKPELEARRNIVLRCEQSCQRISGEMVTSQNVTFKFHRGGFQLDLFFAHDGIVDLISKTPSNYGSVLLCRTGSMFHNRQLCSHAITKGMKFAPYKGVVKMQAGNTANPSCEEIIASETEEDIYKALGLDFLAPTNREALL